MSEQQPGYLFIVVTVALAVTVLSWSANASTAGDGETLFRNKGCIACHSIGGIGGRIGPSLDRVGERYSEPWLYVWLRDPAAVKPGTTMPALGLTDDERARLVFYLTTLRSEEHIAPSAAAPRTSDSHTPDRDPASPENDYLDLGVDTSYLKKQRFSLQDQIQSFIPPIYEPAFTQPAFVLPPGALRTSVSYRDVGTIDESDVAGQREIGARFVDFELKRTFLDFDLFLGLDRNLTVRVNIPVLSASVKQQINPAFLDSISAFPRGSYTEVGDVSLFLKKKFVDQGNFPFGFAGVAALRLPTGADDKKFDGRTTVGTPMGDGIMTLPAIDQSSGAPLTNTGDGTFRRFTDDGELPAPLQPGLGTVGGSIGLFASRIFEGSGLMGKGAFHTGALYEIRPEHDGVDPGNLLTFFASFVKPVYGDRVALDASYVLKDQEKDSYAGKMAVPTGMPAPAPPIMVVDRPSFSGGTTQLAGLSLIYTPNPLFRITLSGLKRIAKPELGPSADRIVRISLQYTFASGLFQ